MSFFKEVFNLYSKVGNDVPDKNKNFYRMEKLVYYSADIDDTTVRAREVIEIDISAAFPTICQFLFEKDDPFVKKLNTISDKLERNIFISTTLKGTTSIKELNYISKMIISSCLMDVDPGAEILELKKDGIIYLGKKINSGKVFKHFTDMGFKIRSDTYQRYVRHRKTSYFFNSDELIIKGLYKERPEFLKKTLLSIEQSDISEFSATLDKIYSNDYFKIVCHNNLDEVFIKYFMCGSSNFLNRQMKYEKVKSIAYCLPELLPKNYLKMFIYPIVLNS